MSGNILVTLAGLVPGQMYSSRCPSWCHYIVEEQSQSNYSRISENYSGGPTSCVEPKLGAWHLASMPPPFLPVFPFP